jgi:hypothetical protein
MSTSKCDQTLSHCYYLNSGSDRVQWDPAQLRFLLQFSFLYGFRILTPYLLLNLPTFIRRTSGHCLGTLKAKNMFLPLLELSLTNLPHFLFLSFIRASKGYNVS